MIIAVLLLIFSGCIDQGALDCPRWRRDSDHATCPQRSTRLFLDCRDLSQGYQIELIRTSDDERLYINLLTWQLPAGTMDIAIQVDDTPPESYPIQVMEGGQRILLGGAAKSTLVDALARGCTITLYLAHRKAVIHPSNFEVYTS